MLISGSRPLRVGVVLSMPGRCAGRTARVRTNRCDSVPVSDISPQTGLRTGFLDPNATQFESGILGRWDLSYVIERHLGLVDPEARRSTPAARRNAGPPSATSHVARGPAAGPHLAIGCRRAARAMTLASPLVAPAR